MPRPASRRSSKSPPREPGPSPSSSQLGSRGRDGTAPVQSVAPVTGEFHGPNPETVYAGQSASRPFGVQNILNPSESRPMSSSDTAKVPRPPRSAGSESAASEQGAQSAQCESPSYRFQGHPSSSSRTPSTPSGPFKSRLPPPTESHSPTSNPPYALAGPRRFLSPKSPRAGSFGSTALRPFDPSASYSLPPSTSLPPISQADLPAMSGQASTSPIHGLQVHHAASLPPSTMPALATPPRSLSQPAPHYIRGQQPPQPADKPQQLPPAQIPSRQEVTLHRSQTPHVQATQPPSREPPASRGTQYQTTGSGAGPGVTGAAAQGQGQSQETRWPAMAGLPSQAPGSIVAVPAAMSVGVTSAAGIKGMPVTAGDPGGGGEPSHFYFRSVHGDDFPVTIDYQQASKQANEKRLRNAGASARFRARKKEKEKEIHLGMQKLEAANRDLTQRVRDLEAERDFYRNDRNRLRNIVLNTPRIKETAQGPPSPVTAASKSVAGSSSFGEGSARILSSSQSDPGPSPASGPGPGPETGTRSGSGPVEAPSVGPSRRGSGPGVVHTPQHGTPQLSHSQPLHKLHHPPPYSSTELERPARRRRTSSQTDYGVHRYSPSPLPPSQPAASGPLPPISYGTPPAPMVPPPPTPSSTPPAHAGPEPSQAHRLPPLRGLEHPTPTTKPLPQHPYTAFAISRPYEDWGSESGDGAP